MIPISPLIYPLNTADISGATAFNRGEFVPFRSSPAHRLFFRFNGAGPTPLEESAYESTVLASGLTFNQTGVFGDAVAFSSGYVEVPGVLAGDIQSGYTFHFGFNPTTLVGGRNTLLSVTDISFNEIQAIWFDSTTGNLQVDHGASSVNFTGVISSAAQFYRVTVTWDTSDVRLYLNGSLVGSPTALATVPSLLGVEYIVGARKTGASSYTDFFTGSMDSMQHWAPVVLSAEEAAALNTLESTGTVFDGTITGSPGIVSTNPVQAENDEGLAFSGTETIASATATAIEPVGDFMFVAKAQHQADGQIRPLASFGADTNVGVTIQKGLGANTNRLAVVVGTGSALETLDTGTDLVNGETIAVVVRYTDSTQLLEMRVRGSGSGVIDVSTTLTNPPDYDAGPVLRVATDNIAADTYSAPIYDVQFNPYTLWTEGNIHEYAYAFIKAPATTSPTQEVDILDHDFQNQPPPGEADPPFLANLVPAAAATGIAVTTNVTGDIVDTGDGVDGSTIRITIDSIVAYELGSLQNSFTGTVVDNGNGSFSYDLTPPSNFPDLTAISVRVEATDLSPLTNSLDQTYTFTTVDSTGPFLTNEVPAPAATAVAQNSNIAFRVTDAASQVDQSTIQVTVNQGGAGAVSAVVNGTIVAPFNGGGATITPVGLGFDYILDPTSFLVEQDTVEVNVLADDVAGNSLNATYTFTTGDQTAPAVTPVAPLGGDSGVTPLTTIVFNITDLGTGIDLATLDVTVNEGSGPTNAITAGSFVAPFNGPNSTIVAITNGFVVTIDKTAQLASSQLIGVTVIVDDNNGNTANVNYSFTTGTAGTINVPISIENKGGGPVSLRGTVPAGTYTVEVVTPGGNLPVYNGRPGSGGTEVIFRDVPGALGETEPTAGVFLPTMPIGGPYEFLLTPVPTGAAITTPPTVTVSAETFDSRTLLFRRVLPPWLRLGIRRLVNAIFPQV